MWCSSDRFNHNTKKPLLIGKSHSMARPNLNKSEWRVTNTATASKYIPIMIRPRNNINWNPPFQTVTYEVNLTSRHSHLEVFLLNKLGSERGIPIDADSGPHKYVVWCCGRICHQPFTFIQIGSDHTEEWRLLRNFHPLDYYCSRNLHSRQNNWTDITGYSCAVNLT